MICVGALFGIASLVCLWKSSRYAPTLAYGGLCAMFLVPESGISDTQFIFWSAAAVIALAILLLLPRQVSANAMGMPYITVAAVTGALVGLIVSMAGMIIGAVAGAFCGSVAFSRTPRGSVLEFPSSRFFNFTCAKGLPAAVVACVCGLIVVAVVNIVNNPVFPAK